MALSREYFGRVARQWDRMRQEYFSDEVREAAIARAGLTSDMVAADVGSGTGFIAAGLAPLVKEVICIDSSPEMLEVARQNLAGFPNVRFEVADGSCLPLPAESVDAAFANMYLHHMPDPLAAIMEMARILKPGGVLVITDEDKHENEWQRAEMADLWLGFERELIRTWYGEAGLEDVSVDCTGQSCCATSECGSRSEISIFVAAGRKPKR